MRPLARGMTDADLVGFFDEMDRRKVLLVEDDPDSRELLAELLEPEFEVETAADGTTGLERFRADHPDVVVTDESLPGMRGTALAREVKALEPNARVVLVSGYALVPGSESCDRVLKKPIEPDTLAAAIHELTDHA
jgi:CheY-like chemotaxis protein